MFQDMVHCIRSDPSPHIDPPPELVTPTPQRSSHVPHQPDRCGFLHTSLNVIIWHSASKHAGWEQAVQTELHMKYCSVTS